MDWVIQAAKKKTKRPPGGSRSIVESLNIFNEVVIEGQSEISSILNETDHWLKSEINTFKIVDTGTRCVGETSSMVSPEKTQSTFDMDYKLGSSLKKTVQENECEEKETPEGTKHEFPSTTPKSLAEDTTTDLVRRLPEQKIGSEIQKDESNMRSEETTIWSPFKRERSLKGTMNVGSQSLVNRAIANPQSSPSVTLRVLESAKETVRHGDTSPPTRSLNQVVKDRSQRRSNMFVPLPNKDPLIVQQAVPEIPAISKTVIPTYTATASYNHLKQKSESSRSGRLSSSNRDIQLMPLKQKNPNKESQTSGREIEKLTSLKVPKATTSVFDRLSSLPTKSSENKIAVKPAEKKMSSSSSIDVTGSPMRRTSFSVRSSAIIDTSIQETLKTIFSSKNRSHVDQKSYQVAKLRSDKASKNNNLQNSDKYVQDSSQSTKKTLVPVHSTHLSNLNNGPRKQAKSEQHMSSMVEIPSGIAHNRIKSPTRQNINETKSDKSASSQTEKSISPNSLTHSNCIPTTIQPLFESNEVRSPSHDKRGENRSKNHDRLTKFQLLPPIESEKDDLKRKLSKRLSEVMRTQQNQHRRKQDQQKRKSNLEEDFKRRTRLWNETKGVPPTENSAGLSIEEDGSPQHPENNNILHDLNVVDHRNIIGGDSRRSDNRYDNDNELANQTLPEINSDSEEEEDYTIPSWASPPYLQQQLYLQQNWDPKKIFGPLPALHIDQIFQNSRFSRLKSRQSTAKNNAV
ncbi:hypothetical protein HG535_0C01280 [Zygotorulaspora mrakii]|uniref:Inner centromere protein ARK-binding domain-containing protein n=1 Tax=Zygotorulaspora mrakii TaxID=42260 RepID=A0A7H9B1D9_ZYGMR|nr:uncharacterized protein HG535_0C01280 [Zygotorulaspora mrakii]QLG71779.1 hypothetical protein HG535_0C01280 [Zygotorulaspora mrakii]